MTGHRSYSLTLETTLELFPPVDAPVLVEATVSLFTDPCYGMDADGRRSEWRTEVQNVEIHSIRLYIPERPTILAARNEVEVALFLTEPELDCVIEQVCEKAFMEDAEEL